ncbi:thioredoxin domain-containing protein, partial [Acinetobacter baumannii]|nr:thioredoxin domain-containing protein [Acinetobacter baumannii]
MKPLNISIDNFTEEVINSQRPVLVDFWASWC